MSELGTPVSAGKHLNLLETKELQEEVSGGAEGRIDGVR